MRAFLGLVISVVLFVPFVATAQDSHAALRSAYTQWLDAHQTTGVFASGAVTADGTWDSVVSGPKAAELASVGKAVTAICVQHLVEDGMLEWSDSLSDVLGAAPDVTIAELITHSSGIGPDATQAAMPLWLEQGSGAHFSAQVLDIVNARGQQVGQRGSYRYNNENYALLGLVIEAVTGRAYFEACSDILALPGAFRPSPDTSEFQPWGGLVSDVAGYLTFLHQHFGPESDVAADPFAYPHVAMGGGANYGLGMVFRPFRDGYNFWHFGALCFPGRLNVGSYVVVWEGRMSAVALYDACVDWGAMAALDNALAAAAFGRKP